jgi:hypothetical protein
MSATASVYLQRQQVAGPQDLPAKESRAQQFCRISSAQTGLPGPAIQPSEG